MFPANDGGIERALFQYQKLIVILDAVPNIINRLLMPPLNVVLTNSGCCFPACALIDLGYDCQITSVELDPVCRKAATALCGDIFHYPSHDIQKLGQDILSQKFDVMLNSSNCQPISGCNPSALGWDDPRMESFVAKLESNGFMLTPSFN